MRYRLYVPGDFAVLYAIEEICFAPAERFSRRYMRQAIGRAQGACWIAEKERRMCGFGLVHWALQEAEVVAYIQTLEVLPEMRGKGVGGELLRLLEGSAQKAGAYAILLHVDEGNRTAIRVYQSQGYRLGGRVADYYGLGRTGLLFAKSLEPSPTPIRE